MMRVTTCVLMKPTKPTNMFILSQVQECHVNVVVVAYSELRTECIVNCATTII